MPKIDDHNRNEIEIESLNFVRNLENPKNDTERKRSRK